MSVEQLSVLYEDLVESIIKSLERGEDEAIREQLQNHHPSEMALVLEALPHDDRARMWRLLPAGVRGVVLRHLHDIARGSLIKDLGEDEASLMGSGERVEVDELADVVEHLPEKVAKVVIGSLDEEERRRFDSHFVYAKGTAGRLMDTDVRTLRPDITIETALRYLRRYGLPAHTDNVLVVDREGRYVGKLFFNALVTAHPHQRVSELMDRKALSVTADTKARDIALLFERRDLLSVAVVDQDKNLLGRIVVTEVLDVIREEGDRTLMNMAGLEEEEDLFAPILPSAKRRAFWLGINLVTAFLAAWVIGMFEATLDKIVALAVLMPIVASMGGIGGSQTLTLAIRGLAMGQISASNSRFLLFKEVAIGCLNGLVWALVVAVITALWFGSYGIGAVIAAAMVINMSVAAFAGILVPLLLDRMGIDPALSGSVVLTTVTDVVGFMTFLGLGTVFLL
jgi:magnesium transporter